MNKIKKNIKKNFKLYFCYGLISFSFLILLVIFIYKPMKLSSNYVYNTGSEGREIIVKFPLIQKLEVDVDNLNSININYFNSNINDFSYNVEILSSNKEVIKSFVFENYGSTILNLPIADLKLNKNDIIYIKFNCNNCENVNLNISETLNNNTYLNEYLNQTLIITLDYYTKQNLYYWYFGMCLVIGLILLPFAKEESNNEK